MTVADVIPAFLAACPKIGPAWQQHLESWGSESDRGDYNDSLVIAHHLVDSFERGDLSEFPAAFGVLERCFLAGDEKAKELATVGIIEDIQNIASHRPFGPSVFYEWLGPESQAAWNELCEFWRKVAEAKAAGLLEPEPRCDQPPAPPPDPSQIENPVLRRVVESLYRRG
jgi:hypothetical protein